MQRADIPAELPGAWRASVIAAGVLFACVSAFCLLAAVVAWLFGLGFATALLWLHLVAGAGVIAFGSLVFLVLGTLPNDPWQRPLPSPDAADRLVHVCGRILTCVEALTAGFVGPATGWSLGAGRSFRDLPPGVPYDRFQLMSHPALAYQKALLPLAIAAAAATAFTAAARGWAGQGALGVFFWLFVANVWARQLRNLIGSPSLPRDLRGSVGSPQLLFAAILLADAATLLISTAALTHRDDLRDFEWSMMLDLAPTLLASGGLRSALAALGDSPAEALTVASGLLFGATMLKTVFDRTAFVRTGPTTPG